MASPKRDRYIGWLSGDGIEIGALHNPLPVGPGVRVKYVDRVDHAVLSQHYPDLDRPFAPVDIVAAAEDLSPIPDSSQDFVIANHLLEHLEDPIRGLKEFHRVLKPDGILFMALPDKRQTFDRNRDLTSIEHLFEEHRLGTERNRRDHYLDFAVNVDGQEPPATEWVDHQMNIGYAIHFHVWKPETFLEFFFAARREFDLDFELAGFAAPEEPTDDEFILLLLKGHPERVRCPPPPPPEPPPPPTLRRQVRSVLARSPLGPPVRLVKRAVRGSTNGETSGS